jgi:hypothetical protein
MIRWVAATALLLSCSLPENGNAPPPLDEAGVDSPNETSVGPDASKDVIVADVPISNDAPVVSAGDALQFSGGSYVDMGGVPIPADFTLEAWIDPASSNNETYVVAEDKRNQGQGQFRFGLTSGKLFFVMSDATGSTHGLFSGGYQLVSSQTIKLGVWTHVAVIKSGAAFTLTINGNVETIFVADASFTHGGPPVAFRVATRVDTNGSSPNGSFDGAIDEVRLWNVARTPSAIASTRSTTVDATTQGLVDCWRFDEGSGNTTDDLLVNGFDGTLVNKPTWITSTAF